MKKTFLLLAIAISLSACVASGTPKKGPIADSQCEGTPKGRTDAAVSYRADSKFEISMKLKWEVGENTEFRIKLKPKRGSENAVVTTTGVSSDPSGLDLTWMNEKGSAASLPDEFLVLCVPPGVAEKTIFKFDINVAGIGTIDPRVEVTY